MNWFKGGIVALGGTLAFAVAGADEELARKQQELIARIERTPGGSGDFGGGVSNHYSSDVLALGADAGPVIPALCEAVEKYRSREAFETLDALGPQVYPHFPRFAKAFAHMRATSTFSKLDYNVGHNGSKLVREDLTPLQLVAFVEHPDVDVRSVAVGALLQRFEGKPLPEEYIPILRRRLLDDSPDIQDVAQRFLYGRPELERSLLPELAEAFRKARVEDPGALQRFRQDGRYHHAGRVALSLAGAISRCGAEAIDEVVTFLDHPSEPHRVLAVAMLTTMATPETTETALTHLDQLAKDPNRHVARQAIEGMFQLGGRSRTRLLIELLEQGPGDRSAAASALGRLRDSAAIEPLHRALAQTHDAPLRIAAANALAAMGPMASEALPTLREAFASDDENLRFAAALAVGKISGSSEEEAAMLARLVQTQDGPVRRYDPMRFYPKVAENSLGRLNDLTIDDPATHERRLLEVLSNLDFVTYDSYPPDYGLPRVVEEGLARYGGERTLATLRDLLIDESITKRLKTDYEETIAAIESRQRTERRTESRTLKVVSP